MTKVAVWCRHEGDNVIGIGAKIPWNVPSDARFFLDVVKNQNVVMGRQTYESLPGKTLPDCQIFVLTRNLRYKVSDKNNHTVVGDVREFKDFEDDLYIAGGAEIYKAFMNGGPKLMPDIVIDCLYQGELNPDVKGKTAEITSCIETLNAKYFKLADEVLKDNVVRSVYLKRGEFVDRAVLKSILLQLND